MLLSYRTEPLSLFIQSKERGQTRESSVLTEGASYLRLAIESNLFHNGFMPFQRATSEDYAMDSYQNLLFSIARFHELTETYPENITVVGYEMKRRRFEDLHVPAIRWPKDRFAYIGIDEQGDTTLHYKGEVRIGLLLFYFFLDDLHTMVCIYNFKVENAFLPFSKDTYGCHDTLLEKRRHRNPSRRFYPYHMSALEVSGLLNWCPGYQLGGYTAIYPGDLPWDPQPQNL